MLNAKITKILFIILTCLTATSYADSGSQVAVKGWNTFARFRSFDFGTTAIGDSKSVNTGACAVCADGGNTCSGTVVHDSVTLEGSADFLISEDRCTGVSLNISEGQTQGDCCSTTVIYKPNAIGSSTTNETFKWTNNEGTPGQFNETISGNGKRPVVPTPQGQCVKNQSTINIDQRSVSEEIPLVGISFSLVYSSDRIQGHGNVDKKKYGFGGWAPSTHMFYDSLNDKLYSGSGAIYKVKGIRTNVGYAVSDVSGMKYFLFDNSGRHYETRDALLGNRTESWIYDSLNRLVGFANQFLQVTEFQYFDDKSIDIISPYGQRTHITFDNNGWLNSVTNPIGENYSIESTSEGYVTQFKKPNGHIAKFNYDQLGYLISDQGSGGNSLTLDSFFDPETQWETVKMTSALGRTTFYQSLATTTGRSLVRTQPDQGQFLSYATDTGPILENTNLGEAHQATQSPDPRWGWTSPFLSRQIFQIVGSPVRKVIDESRAIVLSDSENLLSVPVSLKIKNTLQEDPQRIFSVDFDAVTKDVISLSPLGRRTSKKLNVSGQTSEVKIADLESLHMSYDDKGRLADLKQGSRPSTVFSYDNFGNVASVTDSLGRVSQFKYDGANRIIQKIAADKSEINFTYDSGGNLKTVTPPHRPSHSFSYNILELVSSYLPPNLGQGEGVVAYNYNFDKQITQISRLGETVINLNYDAQSGLLNSLQAGEQSYQMSYQPQSSLINRLVSPDQVILEYQYLGSLVKSVKTSGALNNLFTLDYSPDGSISQLGVQGPSTEPINFILFKYDKDGLLIKAGEESLTRNSAGAITDSQLGIVNGKISFNSYGELEKSTFSTDRKKLFSREYTRDHLGRVIAVTEELEKNKEKKQYIYDKQGRLEKVLGQKKMLRVYSYDANGNRIEKKSGSDKIKAEYDEQDRLLIYGNKKYEYSSSGNLIKMTENKMGHHRGFWAWLLKWDFLFKLFHPHYDGSNSVKVTDFQYDNFGNLKFVNLPNGKKIEYLIDGQNRRIGKKINGQLVQGFIYQSQTQVAAELDGQGKIVKRFVYGSQKNSPDYVIEKEKTYRIVYDQIGTPRMLVDSAQGKITSTFNYDEFGIPEDTDRKENKISAFTFGFAGGIDDEDTGLVRFGARDYDPETGRWVTKDPIGFAGGDTNLMSYVANDPVNGFDPTGLKTQFLITRGALGIGNHIALYIDNGGSPMIFDPGGSYATPLDGTGDIVSGSRANVGAFSAFHQSQFGDSTEVISFDTSAADEAAIANRLQGPGMGGFRGGQCASGVSSAVDGIGPFKGLGNNFFFPGSVGRSLRGLGGR